MNWPDDLEEVLCVGFSDALLSHLAKAWEDREVNIIPGRVRRSSTDISWEFDHFQYRYRIDCEDGSEIRSDGRLWSITTPYRIERIAKVGPGANGEAVVIETYPITSPMILSPKPPAYQGVWGSF